MRTLRQTLEHILKLAKEGKLVKDSYYTYDQKGSICGMCAIGAVLPPEAQTYIQDYDAESENISGLMSEFGSETVCGWLRQTSLTPTQASTLQSLNDIHGCQVLVEEIEPVLAGASSSIGGVQFNL